MNVWHVTIPTKQKLQISYTIRTIANSALVVYVIIMSQIIKFTAKNILDPCLSPIVVLAAENEVLFWWCADLQMECRVVRRIGAQVFH